MLALIACMTVLAVILAYYFSAAGKARRALQRALRSAEALLTAVEQHHASLKLGIQQAAAAYVQDVHAERLRSIPLDALKQRASGLRLQALRDAGIHHLGDLQGWSATRLGQVRGVGPKSAGTIASLVVSLSATAKSAPMDFPDPSLTRPRERQLARAIALNLAANSALQAPAQLWESFLSGQRPHVGDLQKSLAFIPWLTSFGRSPSLREATLAASVLVPELEAESPVRTAIEQALAAPADQPILDQYRESPRPFDEAFATALNLPGPPQKLTPTQEPPVPKKDAEELASITIGTPAAEDVPIPPPHFPLLVKGPVPSLTRAPQTAAEVLQTFLLARQAQTALPTRLQWIGPGQPTVVQGVTLPHGMVYLGHSVRDSSLGAIDPLLPAHPGGTILQSAAAPYPGSYGALLPEQRYACLQWLAQGAPDAAQPAAAMLYFQGLEHRLLAADIPQPERDQDHPQLLAEVERLAGLFTAATFGPGHHYRALADFFHARELQGTPPILPPATDRGDELPLALRYGLGCFLRDRQPIPVDWMLRWADLAPGLSFRTPATRCRPAFQAAFTQLYRELYGDGLVIPPGKTLLKVDYTPTDYRLQGPATQWSFPDIPDITALTVPQSKLRELMEQSTDQVEPYSRFCGRNPGSEQTLAACFHLPRALWPAPAANALATLRTHAASLQTLACQDLLTLCGATLLHLTDLAAGLEQHQIGIEPDVLAGARRPRATDCIVLFPITGPAQDRALPAFHKASLAIALAACVALADGQADTAELDAAERLISGWQTLHPDLRTRLCAQYRVQVSQRATLAALRTRLLALTQPERTEIALDMTRMASADGVVSPAEVKLLESLYRMLGLPAPDLYRHLYGGGSPQQSPRPGNTFVLDRARVQQLQQESAEVSAMLDKVFAPEPEELPPPPPPASTLLPGLDPTHTQLLAQLLTRPQWSRGELTALAASLNLMLDGALERLNDAAFDLCDAAIVEGDDPVYVQAELLEKP